MGQLFGKPKGKAVPAQVTDHDRNLLQLKVQKDRVSKHRTAIAAAIEREASAASERMAAGNRALALGALRRKRYWELHLDKTDQMLLRLEEVLASIEMAHVQKEAFKGLEAGTQVLKELQRDLPLERVERMMSERDDALAIQEEIDRALAGASADEDVEKELAKLEAEVVADALPAAPTTVVEGQHREQGAPAEKPSPGKSSGRAQAREEEAAGEPVAVLA